MVTLDPKSLLTAFLTMRSPHPLHITLVQKHTKAPSQAESQTIFTLLLTTLSHYRTHVLLLNFISCRNKFVYIVYYTLFIETSILLTGSSAFYGGSSSKKPQVTKVNKESSFLWLSSIPIYTKSSYFYCI